MSNAAEQELEFVLAAYEELTSLPAEVQDVIGYALDLAQRGETHHKVKAMPELGSGVMQITARHMTDTYRGYYAVKFKGVIYVLYCFNKKSKTGNEMSEQDKAIVRARYKEAQRLFEER
jgi:phage-related protein